MAKTALATLKTWFETGDKPTQSQFENFLDSFHHLDGGEVITNVAITGTDIELTLSDASIVTIPIYTLPANMPISFITGLQAALDNKVDKITGKGLSTNDFTTVLLNKLNSLNNYVHPATHEISEVNGLQGALDVKTETGAYAGTSQDLKDDIDAIGSSREILINGYWFDTIGNVDVNAIEVNNKFRGWVSNTRYVVGNVIALPFDVNDPTKVTLVIDNQ